MRIVLVLLCAGALVSCTSPALEQPATTPAPTKPAPADQISCDGQVKAGPLPVWARGGFSPPDTPVPHIVGVNEDIVGVAFGHPFHAPKSAPGRNNKILWIANPDAPPDSALPVDDSGALKIHATLNGSGLAVDRQVSVGPSQVDMPRAGCWTFTLSWAGHHDEIAVPYEPT
jgi:hypothetical protein